MASSYWGDGFMDEVDEINEESNETKPWEVGRDGLILLIDATQLMFHNNDNNNFDGEDEDGENMSPFTKCMKCAKSVIMNKIISNDKDLFGIVFFGTDKRQNSSDFDHIFTVQDLDMLDANRVLQVEELEGFGAEEFQEKYGHSDDFALSDALWECSNMFANTTYKLANKRILLFTVNDDPHRNNREVQKRTLKKAKDLQDIGVDVELMNLGAGFDVMKFYCDVVGEEGLKSLGNPTEKFEELISRVRIKESKKRVTSRCLFNMGGGTSFSVGMYTMNRIAVKGTYTSVDSRSNEEVKHSTKYICCDTAEELLPTDVKLYQEFGGAKVIFEKEEVAKMKNMCDRGFQLLGFKPRKYLKPYYHIKEASFMYPDESTVIGSTSLFTVLLECCAERDVMPICVYKGTGPPRIVALLPQQEEIDEDGTQSKPPGFNVVYLPYSDEIRKLKIPSHAKASESQIDAAKEVVDQLKFRYTPDMFENPSLQKFFRGLEAFALDRDDIEDFKDLTVANSEEMEQKAEDELTKFINVAFPEGYNAESAAAAATKRKAPSSTSAAAKKPKVQVEVDVDMKDVAEKGNLKKLTVPVLKAFCQSNGIKAASQKKGDLIDAINNHFMV